MRQIKFRALDMEKRVWVYGTYYKDKNDYFMVEEITGSHIKIDYETVGQFTGRKDKYNKEIYEGGILSNKSIIVGEVKFGEYKCRNQSKDDSQLNHIGWYVKQEINAISLEYLFWNLQDNLSIKKREDQNWVEVIGNIYENPESIK